MKKHKCYPKYSYSIYLIISLILFLFSLGPVLIETDEKFIIKIIFSSVMILFSIIMFIGFLWTKQYFKIEGNEIIISNCFGTINRINLQQCTIQVIELPTYFSWVASINKKWICIYDNSKYIPKFKSGCSNGKKYKRIQVIYSNETADILKIEK